MRVAVVAMLLAGAHAAADTEINRCLLADGTIAFQELPCPEPAASNEGDEVEETAGESDSPAADATASDFVNPFDEPAGPPAAEAPAPRQPPGNDRAECEQSTRDAIDAIDREIAVTGNNAQERLPELLALTEQLRDCKRL